MREKVSENPALGAESSAEKALKSTGEVQAVIRYDDDVGNRKQKPLTLTPATTLEHIEMHVREMCPNEFDNLNIYIMQEQRGTDLLPPISLKHQNGCVGDLVELNSENTYIILALLDKQAMSLDVNDTSEDDLLLGASASPTSGEVPSSTNDLPAPSEFDAYKRYPVGPNGDGEAPATSISTGESSSRDSSVEMINYVGLVNQAMTCYLNSLVQALYMTPEFRNAIYNWEFDGQHETRSIPYQLQKLFLNLQTSEKSAVETTDLTTSFGWQGSDAWHQHDIQELCRVMFEALERKFKDTKQANLINDLYEGKMLDYVKCLECGTEKSREDTFLDIPLPVRPFGSGVAFNSVEEALRAFVQPETLEGNNQYHCEKCNKKCDAHKGLKFIKFPYLLTLHLKRFDFDYNTMHRIKLNDKVVFPEKLNLNSFVPNSRLANEPIEERDNVVKSDDCSTTDSGSALDDESCQGTDVSCAVNDQDDNCEDSDEGIDVSSGNNVHHESMDAKGPFNYELFSIMIHSGSASGGHYYAYIKDFDKNHWLCFNDQSVNRITKEDIKRTYGGGPQKGYYSGMYTASTNAYMLMYRQIDKARNVQAMKVEEFPPHMQKLLEYIRSNENCQSAASTSSTAIAIREKQTNTLRLSVNCIHPHSEEMLNVRMGVLNDATLEDAVGTAVRRFKLDGVVNAEDCRLVIYNKKQQCIDCSFESDDLKFCDIVEKFNMFCADWLLEIKEPGTSFKTFKKDGIDLRVYQINFDTEEVKEPIVVRVDVGDTVKILKENLCRQLGLDLNSTSNSKQALKLVLTKSSHRPEELLDDDQQVPLFESCLHDFKLYMAQINSNFENNNSASNNNNNKTYDSSSKLMKIVEKFEHIIYLNVLLPDTDPDTLENLFIPSLDNPQSIVSNGLSDANDIVGMNSPNLRISPQPPAVSSSTDNFNDQSNSEDSSLSDSDRTLVGDAPEGSQNFFPSTSTSPADQHMTSPMDPGDDNNTYSNYTLNNQSEENWDNDLNYSKPCNFFKVTSVKDMKHTSDNVTYTKLCKLYVDSFTTLDTFKKCLESVVRVPKEYFKIYRQSDEEWSTLSDSLQRLKDGQTLCIKLGRALTLNERVCKIYHLKPASSDTNNLLFEHVVSKGQTIGDVKKEILFRAKKIQMLDIQWHKCRLRERNMKRPKEVYLDDQVFGEDVALITNMEMYLQELNEPERVTSTNQLVLFARHWCPTTMTLQPFQEIVLDSPLMSELKEKVAEMSNIPLECVQVAFLKSNFPCDMNLLSIHSDLEWDKHCPNLDQWPCHAEDGTVFFYRDSREELKELTPDERKEITIKESARLRRVQTKNSATWERSLKIYSDNWPSESEDNCMD